MHTISSIKRALQEKARDLGFAQCRVTTADPVPSEQLVAWLGDDKHGTMRWIARDPVRRCDPSSLLPAAASVICCALPYDCDGLSSKSLKSTKGISQSPSTQHDGVHFHDAGLPVKHPSPPIDFDNSAMTVRTKKTSRLYRGADYHEVVRGKLRTLAEELKRLSPGAKTKCCVDTSPILEKALAARAGLGWIGKNTLLINPALGSWFVLGEVITDVALEPDAPLDDRCGDCRSCLEACPTNALGERSLDARRCIAYLTIEHRGEIPADLAGHVPPDAYGCDICQVACPHNTNR